MNLTIKSDEIAKFYASSDIPHWEEKVTFKNPRAKEAMEKFHYFQLLVQEMNALRQSGYLCDVEIKAGTGEFKCHRLVLAAACPYFRAMFTSDLFEAKQKRIEIKDMDESTMKHVIEFIYTGSTDINTENVQNLLVAAVMLQVPRLDEMCCNYLSCQLYPSNCLGIRKFAETHGCFELQEGADKYIQRHFKDIAKTEEFLQLTAEELIDIISRDSLNVRKEEEVYNAVMNWVEADLEHHMDTMEKIFEHVRLPLVTWDFLKERVGKNKLFTTREDCKRFLKEARQFHSQLYHPDLLPYDCNTSVLRARPRKYFGLSEHIYIVGGQTSPGQTTMSSIEVYHPYTKTWSELPNLPNHLRAVGACAHNGSLYCIGGCEGMKACNTMHRLCLQQKTWHSMPPMEENRSSVAVTVCGDFIYACGGYNDVCSVRTVERFDLSVNAWARIEDMNTARSMAGAATLGDHVYVVGGYDGITDLMSGEEYNPQTKAWTNLPDLHHFRCMPDVAALKGKLYAVGGMDHNVSVKTAEVFDPVTNAWTMIAAMTHPRSGVGISTIGNHIYALGGYDGQDYLSSVEKYDVESDKWDIVGQMVHKRWRFGCCC